MLGIKIMQPVYIVAYVVCGIFLTVITVMLCCPNPHPNPNPSNPPNNDIADAQSTNPSDVIMT